MAKITQVTDANGIVKQTYPLHDLRYVNTVLSMLYDENGNYRPGFKPEEFYNAILLDTLSYGEENYVHTKYCENITIRKGESTAKFRRWSGMTPTIRPLREGLPPMPDKHAYEVMEIGNVFSFGRWSEYSDAIDTSIISDVISERSNQYGELAAQIKELYVRKTWLSSPNEYFANFKEGFNDLAFGDKVSIDDLRYMTTRMRRAMVKPAEGSKFNYICDQEFIDSLFDDPRVKQYMLIEQTTGNLFTTGEPFPLFELNFIPTMLDEFAYPDTEFPGVYELSTGDEAIRYYAVHRLTAEEKAALTGDDLKGAVAKIYILTIHQDFLVGDNAKIKQSLTGYLNDGTAVEDQAFWTLPDSAATLISSKLEAISLEEPTAAKVQVRVQYMSREVIDAYGNIGTKFYDGTYTSADATVISGLVTDNSFVQLPVHRGILFGAEALVKINIEGLSDAPQIIVQPLGSAGTNDPLKQRQSIGFRCDGVGYAIKRPEAICITYSIPTNAEFAALTAQYLQGNPTLLHNEGNGMNNWVEGTGYYGGQVYQGMRVDRINNAPNQGPVVGGFINNGAENGFYSNTALASKIKGEIYIGASYTAGDYFTYGTKLYEVVQDVEFAADGNKTLDEIFTANKAKVKAADPITIFKNLFNGAETNATNTVSVSGKGTTNQQGK